MDDYMKRYVLGFCFNEELDLVVIIRKTKPDWQKGKYNGVGGKFEFSDETYSKAMSREFEEETGVKTLDTDWYEFATLQGPDWICPVFALKSEKAYDAKTMTEEPVSINPTWAAAVHCDNLPNVGWLILMAQDILNKPEHERFSTFIHY